MPVLSITTAETAEGVLKNLNTGMYYLYILSNITLCFVSNFQKKNNIIIFFYFFHSCLVLHPVLTPSMEKNGVILLGVTTEICVSIATPELSSNFIQRFTNPLNVMTCRRIVIVLEDHFVLLLTEILKW